MPSFPNSDAVVGCPNNDAPSAGLGVSSPWNRDPLDNSTRCVLDSRVLHLDVPAGMCGLHRARSAPPPHSPQSKQHELQVLQSLGKKMNDVDNIRMYSRRRPDSMPKVSELPHTKEQELQVLHSLGMQNANIDKIQSRRKLEPPDLPKTNSMRKLYYSRTTSPEQVGCHRNLHRGIEEQVRTRACLGSPCPRGDDAATTDSRAIHVDTPAGQCGMHRAKSVPSPRLPQSKQEAQHVSHAFGLQMNDIDKVHSRRHADSMPQIPSWQPQSNGTRKLDYSRPTTTEQEVRTRYANARSIDHTTRIGSPRLSPRMLGWLSPRSPAQMRLDEMKATSEARDYAKLLGRPQNSSPSVVRRSVTELRQQEEQAQKRVRDEQSPRWQACASRSAFPPSQALTALCEKQVLRSESTDSIGSASSTRTRSSEKPRWRSGSQHSIGTASTADTMCVQHPLLPMLFIQRTPPKSASTPKQLLFIQQAPKSTSVLKPLGRQRQDAKSKVAGIRAAAHGERRQRQIQKSRPRLGGTLSQQQRSVFHSQQDLCRKQQMPSRKSMPVPCKAASAPSAQDWPATKISNCREPLLDAAEAELAELDTLISKRRETLGAELAELDTLVSMHEDALCNRRWASMTEAVLRAPPTSESSCNEFLGASRDSRSSKDGSSSSNTRCIDRTTVRNGASSTIPDASRRRIETSNSAGYKVCISQSKPSRSLRKELASEPTERIPAGQVDDQISLIERLLSDRCSSSRLIGKERKGA